MMTEQALLERIKQLRLHGLLAHWERYQTADWLPDFLQDEEAERDRRSLERRQTDAKLGRFKLLSDFDWGWPKSCIRQVIKELMQLHFLESGSNVIFCGPNGVGKTTLACNITYQAILKGHTALLMTAGQMLSDLATQESDRALKRRIAHYTKPSVLLIDEVGYLSYSNRHADLLFEVISRRYQKKSTLITTNKAFAQWNEIFPNASCTVSIIDRLVHHSEIVKIEAASFRLKEAKAQEELRQQARHQESQETPGEPS